MKNFTIIFRMTNSCNLNCVYCYDKNNHTGAIQENKEFLKKIPDIIENISKLWENKYERSEIIFHGGEPLIISTKCYDRLIKGIKQLYPNVKFSIQTNGTLINEEIVSILKKYHINVGISIDGFNEITNKYRVDFEGKNSFNRVMKNIQILKDNNINFGIIMTLTNSIKGKEEELYKFISENNLKCNIRPAFQCDDNNIDFMTNEDYFEFFKNLFKIWINDEERKVKLTQIREIYDEFVKILEPSHISRSCSTSGKCFMNFISLDCDGNIYSCNRTYNNKEFFYGNILNMDMENLKNIIESRQRERQHYLSNSKCKDCFLYRECNGGCPSNAFLMHQTLNSADDYFCTAKINIRRYLSQYLEKSKIKEEYIEMIRNDKKLYK